MLTTKKWPRPFASSAAVVRRLTFGSLAMLLAAGSWVGCSPAGRNSVQLGERLLRQGRPAEAIEPLKEAVARFATNAPACAQAWNYLGLAYHYADRPADAAQAYQNALAKDFNLIPARFNRGCLFLEQGNLPGAINELTTYTTHQPKDATAWLLLGAAQLRARSLDAADRSLQRVLELNPDPPAAALTLNNLGYSQALRRRPNDAFKYFNAALKQQSNYPPALLNQAIVAQQQLNDRPLALQRYRAYLDVAGTAAPNLLAVSNVFNQLDADLRLRAAATNPPPASVVATNPPVKTTNLALTVKTSPPPAVLRSNAAPAPVAAKPPPPATVAPAAPTTPIATGSSPTPSPQSPATPQPTNRVDLASASPPPAAKPQPPPAEPPPLPVEVVRLDPEPAVKTAQDPASVPKSSAAATTANLPPSAPVPSPVAATAAQPTTAPAAPTTARPGATTPSSAETTDATDEKPKKKSFVQKLNPLGWFGSKDKKETPKDTARGAESTVTPLAASPQASRPAPPPTAQPVATTRPAVPATAPPATPAPPAFPRYSYVRPGTPVAGDRTRAEQDFTEGLQAHKAGQTAAALAAYQKAVRADPSFFDAQYNLGVAAFDSSRWPEALTAFEHALAIKPGDTSARLNFALALERANYPLDAARELETLLAAAPDNIDACLAAANVYSQQLGDKTKARPHYQKVLQLNPRHPQAPVIRRWLAANRE